MVVSRVALRYERVSAHWVGVLSTTILSHQREEIWLGTTRTTHGACNEKGAFCFFYLGPATCQGTWVGGPWAGFKGHCFVVRTTISGQVSDCANVVNITEGHRWLRESRVVPTAWPEDIGRDKTPDINTDM